MAGQKKTGPDQHCNSAHGSMLTGSSSMSSFLVLALSLSVSAWQHFNHLGPAFNQERLLYTPGINMRLLLQVVIACLIE